MKSISTFNTDAVRRIGAVVRAVERDGGGGARRRGKFEDAAAAQGLLSFYPRLGKDEEGALKLYIRKGYASLAGGEIVEVAPDSGDEFELDVTLPAGQTAAWLQWNKPADPDDPQEGEGWSIQTGSAFPSIGEALGMDVVRAPLCLVSASANVASITWMSPGDKLGVEGEPGSPITGPQDVLVYDHIQKRFARVQDVPDPEPEELDAFRWKLQRLAPAGSGASSYFFRWVRDIPAPDNDGSLLRWDETDQAWYEVTGTKGDILYFDDGWKALAAPAGASLLRCSGDPNDTVAWVAESNYLNP